MDEVAGVRVQGVGAHGKAGGCNERRHVYLDRWFRGYILDA